MSSGSELTEIESSYFKKDCAPGTQTKYIYSETKAWHFRPHYWDAKTALWTEAQVEKLPNVFFPNRPIKILSFNVWFGELEMPKRMLALGDIIAKEDPDLVALQEVTAPINAELLAQQWAKSYFVSDPFGKELMRYGVMIMSKINFHDLCLRDFQSRQGRKALFGTILVDGKEQLTFGTFHFESYPHDEPVRKIQMAHYQELTTPGHHVILTGDSNIAYPDREDDLLKPRFSDLWPSLYPNKAQEGATFDMDNNLMGKKASGMAGAYRLDRLFFTGDSMKGHEMRVIGKESFVPALWPSDHYGIVGTLSFM